MHSLSRCGMRSDLTEEGCPDCINILPGLESLVVEQQQSSSRAPLSAPCACSGLQDADKTHTPTPRGGASSSSERPRGNHNTALAEMLGHGPQDSRGAE
ncbi:hypothetical protein EYF80_003317 [Liparis tanakae]|uniref:Uncharacterized protein n=1 Tax=Liparis tanakae TaxID=230148 RepID=A0A4Z2J939_9TELE|nr:hypothetical protein EYF80_003317 [Liparis tanakae]